MAAGTCYDLQCFSSDGTDVNAGDRIGRYLLEQPLGRGGMGVVWLAVLEGPRGFRRRVALKFLQSGPSANAEYDLAHEARLGGLLTHPNVAGTYELGEADGRWFVAMEWVDGPNLTELCRRLGRLPPRAVLEIGSQLASALDALHTLKHMGLAAGLVHRDVKPSNILVDRHGIVKLVDLGVARMASDSGSRSTGTPAFMAPEQYTGIEDSRADLFSAGCVLFYLVTGRRPFGKGADAMTTVQNVDDILDHPDFLAPVESRVPGLGPVLHRCLQADPERRFPSAQALGNVLSAIIDAQPPCPALAELVSQSSAESTDTNRATVRRAVDATDSGTAPIPRFQDDFVGRARELEQLEHRIESGARLIVLTGPGGMGKTRLALAASRSKTHTVGVCFVDLTEVRSLDDLCATVSRALGVPLLQSDAVSRLGRALAGRGRMIVILDNFEQVVELAPLTLTKWLQTAPRVTFLVTSRVRLDIRGEVPFEVGALDPEAAAELFWTRAPRGLSQEERDALPELLARIDNMPLAIELAAARTRVLKVPQILERLHARFKLLSGMGAGRPARHRSLRAALDVSWEHLSPWEKSGLAQLSTFSSGWTMEAAEAVLDLSQWPDAPWTFDVVAALLDHSLVRFDRTDDRFSMLASIVEYASETLENGDRVAQRHGAWFAQFGSPDALDALERRGGVDRFNALRHELDNVTMACRWAIARGDEAVAIDTCLAACRVLRVNGAVTAAFPLLNATMAMEGDHRRPELACELAAFYLRTSRHEEAAEAADRALALSRLHGTARFEGVAMYTLAEVDRHEGRYAQAARHMETAVPLLRDGGDLRHEILGMWRLAHLHIAAGRTDESRAVVEAALAVAERAGASHLAPPLYMRLADIQSRALQFREARRQLEAARENWAETGHRPGEIASCFALGIVHAELGDLEEGCRLLTRGSDIARKVGGTTQGRICRYTLANLHILQGDLETAHPLAQDAFDSAIEGGDKTHEMEAGKLLGWIARKRGDHDEALRLLEAALELSVASGLKRINISILRELAILHLARGDVREARRCADEGAALLDPADKLAALLVGCVRARVSHAEADFATAQERMNRVDGLMAEAALGPETRMGSAVRKARKVVGARAD